MIKCVLLRCLTLAELEALARLRTTRLLTLDLSGISRQHPFLAQRRTGLAIPLDESTRHSQTNGIGLSSDPATPDASDNIELRLAVNHLEGLDYANAVQIAREIIFQGLPVDGPLSRPGTKDDPRRARLPTANSVDEFRRRFSHE
jgi:hypothetical protein